MTLKNIQYRTRNVECRSEGGIRGLGDVLGVYYKKNIWFLNFFVEKYFQIV